MGCPEITIPALTGRAGRSQQSKIFQLFAQIVDPVGVFQTPDLNRLEPGWQRDYQPQIDPCEPHVAKCERLYRVSTGCQVIYRNSPNDPISPLDPSVFYNTDNGSPLPAGSVTGGDGYFRVLVTVSAARGPFSFFMDVDETIEIFAFSISMLLIGPPGTVLVTDRNKVGGTGVTATLVGNIVVDARIGASIEPIETGTGCCDVKYTQIVPVPQGQSVTIEVPKYSRSVRIIQNNLGPASGPWQRIVGTVAPLNVGQIDFDGRISRVQDEPLGRESSLVTNTSNASARLFQVQWTIRP